MSYRHELFPKTFAPAEFTAFRASYEGINPDRPLETASVSFRETVGLEPHMFYLHAMFLNAVYERPGVSFFNAGWENLDADYLGNFDLVNCLGLIYHLREPVLLLETIASIMKPGAKRLMETHVLSQRSKQACFIENAFWGDVTYWWIFGDECLMRMLRSSGFKDVDLALKAECDSRNPDNPRVTVEGHPAGARAWFTATKA